MGHADMARLKVVGPSAFSCKAIQWCRLQLQLQHGVTAALHLTELPQDVVRLFEVCPPDLT